ncbi:MAG: IclR family transcriptional regulator [Gordonia sp. (in: high G+C Gram-positive bacteria)]
MTLTLEEAAITTATKLHDHPCASSSPSMIDRVTAIMDAFDEPDVRLTLDEVSRHTGLPRSTAHRILDQLVHTCWLTRAGNIYRLGPGAIGLGMREVTYNELRAAAHSRLRELSWRTGLVVHLGCLDQDEVYYIDKFGGMDIRCVPSDIGVRLPASCTSLGKSILAWLPQVTVGEMYSGKVPTPTGDSLASWKELSVELSHIRAADGVAVDRGECFADIACVGVAIRDEHGPVAAISAVGRKDAPLERLAPVMRSIAHEISLEIIG